MSSKKIIFYGYSDTHLKLGSREGRDMRYLQWAHQVFIRKSQDAGPEQPFRIYLFVPGHRSNRFGPFLRRPAHQCTSLPSFRAANVTHSLIKSNLAPDKCNSGVQRWIHKGSASRYCRWGRASSGGGRGTINDDIVNFPSLLLQKFQVCAIAQTMRRDDASMHWLWVSVSSGAPRQSTGSRPYSRPCGLGRPQPTESWAAIAGSGKLT